MKKQFFNKITSLLLALVMVLSLVPMTALGVFAEDADVDLEADTMVIDSVADWNAVAEVSADKDFSGKVIVLGNNIVFGDEAAPVLFAGTFKGEFYGNGMTVSGKTLAGKNLIAATVDGGTISGDDVAGSGKVMTISGFSATIASGTANAAMVAAIIQNGAKVKNITVKECNIDSSQSSSVGIVVSQAKNTVSGKDTRISNCTVEDCTILSKSQSAAIVADIPGSKSTVITVENCTVTGTTSITGATRSVSNAAAAIGAVVGKVNGDAFLTVDSCTVGQGVTVTSQNNRDWAYGIGMIVGQAGVIKDSKASYGELKVMNCVASGTLKSSADRYKTTGTGTADNDKDGATFTISAGGIIGVLALDGNNVISNCMSTVVFDTSASGLTIGQICGSYLGATQCSLEISNCSSTVSFSANHGNFTVGGVLGNYQGVDKATLNISKCNVSGTIADSKASGGSPRMAGVLGRGQGTADGNVTIEKCYVDIDVSANAKYDKLGGIVGEWNTASAKLFIRDSYYEGSIVSGQNKSVGAIIGTKGGNVTQTTVSIGNVIVNVAVSMKLCPNQNFTNIATSYTMNGNVESAGFVKIENENITAESLIKRDANGFIECVKDYVNCNLVQLAKQADGKYAVRFIGTSVFGNLSAASMEVSLAGNSFVKENSTILNKLDAYGESDTMTEILPETYGAEKFCAILVKNVPAEALEGGVFTVSITITVGEGDGAEIYEATFTGTIPPAALA